MPMEIVKWFSEDDVKGSVDEFVKKFDDGSLTGADATLFFKAMAEAGKISLETDDEDKQEYAEILADDIEEYESLAYCTEVRGDDNAKFIQVMTEDEQKLGIYSGAYDENDPLLAPYKNKVWMDMTPDTMLQIMRGNPNTDAQFFSGDLAVKGSLKLATKPREWIYAFFDFIEREPE
ncbi:MAG: SCP2 sterol-binding domain-containing protein [Promethearchaeota archaeon]